MINVNKGHEGSTSMRFNTILLLLMIFSLTVVSAQVQTLGTFKQGENVTLIQNCQTSTTSNITRITYPNSTIALDVVTPMVKDGDDYSFIYNDTETLGRYLVYGTCDELGTATNWVYDYEINVSGLEPSDSDGLIIIVGIAFMVLLAFLMIWLSIKIRNTMVSVALLVFGILLIGFTVGAFLQIIGGINGQSSLLISNFNALYIISIGLIGVTVIGVIVYLITISLKLFNSMRGTTDQFDLDV